MYIQINVGSDSINSDDMKDRREMRPNEKKIDVVFESRRIIFVWWYKINTDFFELKSIQ